MATQGTEASPYTVTDAKTVKTGTGKYIKGYIVGYVPGMALNEAIFGDASSAETAPTNILLAAKADEKEVKNCMPIQLPAGDLRTALNLKDNSGNLKKELIICGNIETYFGATGLKSPVYAKIDGKEIGKKPGDTTPGSDLKGEAKGDGSEANPFNSVAAQKYTAAWRLVRLPTRSSTSRVRYRASRSSLALNTATVHSILPMMPTAPSSTSSASTTSVAKNGKRAI